MSDLKLFVPNILDPLDPLEQNGGISIADTNKAIIRIGDLSEKHRVIFAFLMDFYDYEFFGNMPYGSDCHLGYAISSYKRHIQYGGKDIFYYRKILGYENTRSFS